MHNLVVLEQFDGVDQLSHQDLGQVLPDTAEFLRFGSASKLVDQGFQVTIVAQFENENYRLITL